MLSLCVDEMLIWSCSLAPGRRGRSGIAFAAPAVTAFATFALIGFYAALIPDLLRDSLGQSSPLMARLVVFGLFGVAAAMAAMTAKLSEWAAVLSGLALLPPALAILVAAQLLQIASRVARRRGGRRRQLRPGLPWLLRIKPDALLPHAGKKRREGGAI
jgi:hypothetical protein